MGITTQTFKPPEFGVSKNALITNINIIAPNTETAHGLQNSVKQILVRNRSYVTTKLSFLSAGPFITLAPGTTYAVSEVDFSGMTLYLQASAISTIEIVELY